MPLSSTEQRAKLAHARVLFEEIHSRLAQMDVLKDAPGLVETVLELNQVLAGLDDRPIEAAFWQAKLAYHRHILGNEGAYTGNAALQRSLSSL